jgi:hypothetical protein
MNQAPSLQVGSINPKIYWNIGAKEHRLLGSLKMLIL